MIPRDDQLELIDDAREEIARIKIDLANKGIKRKPRLMVQAGCGFGKTFLAAWMTKSALEKGGTTAFLSHRGFLVDQTSSTFKALGIRHSFLAAGKPLNPKAKAFIGMIGSMRTRQHKIAPPTICWVDESHHAVAQTWRNVFDAWPNTTFIGLSATPGARSDKVGLGEVYDGIVCGPSVSELIASGALSGYRYFEGRPPAELLDLKLSAADSADAQASIMDKPVIIGDIVGTYKKMAMGKRAIYFAPNIKMSMDLADAFNAAGVPFVHIDQSTPDWERKKAARDIAKGNLMGFSNVTIAGEGFDLAAQAGLPVTVEVTGLCRRTQSLPLLIQMAMRSMRAKADGSPGIILDHCANSALHDQWLPDNEIEWSLDGAIRKQREIKPVQCPHCLATGYPIGHICNNCGGNVSEPIAAAAARAQMEVIAGELIELKKHEAQQAAATEAAIKHQNKLAEWSCKTYADWLALGKARNYQNPQVWASMRYNLKQKRRA